MAYCKLQFYYWGRIPIEFALPESHLERRIHWEMHPAENLGYDIIIGQDLMQELDIMIDFARDICIWDRAELPMKSRDATSEEVFHINEPDSVANNIDHIKKILDAKYEPANLDKVVDRITYLNPTEKTKLNRFLRKHENLFDGTLRKWVGRPYEIELKEGAMPHHMQPYPLPRAHKKTLKM